MTTGATSQGAVTAHEVERILVDNAGIEAGLLQDNHDVPLSDLGVDSLAMLELRGVAEDRYHIDLPEEVGNFSISEIVDTLNEATAGGIQ